MSDKNTLILAVELIYERSTKNCHVYIPWVDDQPEARGYGLAPITSLYIRKDTIGLDAPDRITVSIERVSEG